MGPETSYFRGTCPILLIKVEVWLFLFLVVGFLVGRVVENRPHLLYAARQWISAAADGQRGEGGGEKHY